MTAPFQVAGFPETREIVSGDPSDDKGQLSDVLGDAKQLGKKPGQSIQSIAKGFWLTGDPEKVAKDIDTRWNAQNTGQKTGLARGEVNTRRRAGDPYSKLVKETDQDTYKVYTPRGIEQAPPSLNKTDDLCVKVVATLTVDPPKPECEPASDSDDDRASAEFSTRVLMNESTESGLNIPDLVRDAEDLACSWGSGYVYAYVDPQGGGHRPKEVMAPQGATQLDPTGQPVLTTPSEPDPMTGQPGPPGLIQGPPMLRYVGADGLSIVDDPGEALLEWTPKVCAEMLTRKNLRFLPETATGIRDASGVLIAAFDELGDLKATFPDVAAMDADALRTLVSYRPAVAKLLLPKHAGTGEGTKGPDYDASKGPPDDALVLTITGYRRGGGDYPLGAYVVMGGGKHVLHRQPWSEQIPGTTGKPVDRAMDVPVAQFRQFKDTRTNDPHGRGLVDRIGDGDPLVSFAIGAIIEYLHRVNNPHLFVPIGSGVQAKSLQLPRGTPIPFNPAAGGKPQQEEIAPLPGSFMEFIQFIRSEQDSVSGLEATAQGVSSPSVQSGKHAQQIIEQALVALSGTKAEMEAGYQRLCRIVLQLVRKYYTTPMRLKIVGEDGAFKEREWLGSDLGTTTDVKIMAGTSTMLSASAKSAIALEKLQSGAITMEDYQRADTGNVRALIGQLDNPAKTRVVGQIAAWNDGPPEGWTPQAAPVDPVTGQPPVDPRTGQPIPAPPDPANPFADTRAVDQEQAVAIIRHQALSRAESGSKYRTKPPEWQQYLGAEYESMRRAAGIQTIAEQQAAQAAQAQAQASAAATKAAQEEANEGRKEGRQHGMAMARDAANAESKSVQQRERMESQAAAGAGHPATQPQGNGVTVR